LGVLGGRYAGLPPALFRYRNVRSFRPAREFRITWPHGPRARQCHYDKCGREDRPHDGICFEPSIECAPVLPGQPAIVRSYAASAVAIAAFGSGVPKSPAAMIIVVPATTQIAATRVILRIANLLPRPESACRDAGNGKRSPANRHLHRTHDEPGAATLRVSYFTP